VYPITFSVRSTAAPIKTSQVTDTVNVIQVAAVDIGHAYGPLAWAPGQQLQFEYDLANTGNATDRFTISAVQDLNWNVTVDAAQTPSVTRAGRYPIRVNVQIPANSPPGTTNHITLRAASVFSPSVFKEVVETITVPTPGTPVASDTYQAPAHYLAGKSPSAVTVGDFNRDGKADLAVAHLLAATPAGYNISILLGNGNGAFQTARHYTAGESPQAIIAGDVNGDGKLDLAVADRLGDTVSVLLGLGDGTFQAAVHYASSSTTLDCSPIGCEPVDLALGDVDGDSKPDLVVANFRGHAVGMLRGNGDGTFQAATDVALGSQSWPVSMELDDLNADTKLDLIVANINGDLISVLLGNGNGTFQAATNNVLAVTPRSVAIGDLNNDGKRDLAVASYFGNNVSILLGNGNGIFQPAVSYPAGDSPFALIIGDLNGDGKRDLAVPNHVNNGTISLLLGNGDGSFQAPRNDTVESSPAALAVGDLNGDNKPDLVAANNGNSSVSVLLNRHPRQPRRRRVY